MPHPLLLPDHLNIESLLADLGDRHPAVVRRCLALFLSRRAEDEEDEAGEGENEDSEELGEEVGQEQLARTREVWQAVVWLGAWHHLGWSAEEFLRRYSTPSRTTLGDTYWRRLTRIWTIAAHWKKPDFYHALVDAGSTLGFGVPQAPSFGFCEKLSTIAACDNLPFDIFLARLRTWYPRYAASSYNAKRFKSTRILTATDLGHFLAWHKGDETLPHPPLSTSVEESIVSSPEPDTPIVAESSSTSGRGSSPSIERRRGRRSVSCPVEESTLTVEDDPLTSSLLSGNNDWGSPGVGDDLEETQDLTPDVSGDNNGIDNTNETGDNADIDDSDNTNDPNGIDGIEDTNDINGLDDINNISLDVTMAPTTHNTTPAEDIRHLFQDLTEALQDVFAGLQGQVEDAETELAAAQAALCELLSKDTQAALEKKLQDVKAQIEKLDRCFQLANEYFSCLNDACADGIPVQTAEQQAGRSKLVVFGARDALCKAQEAIEAGLGKIREAEKRVALAESGRFDAVNKLKRAEEERDRQWERVVQHT